jgi:adenylate cyclase, class 2
MREVEVKAHIRNAEELLEKLKELGSVLGEPVTQADTVYVKETGSMETFLANEHFLRIRKTPEKVIFTLKYHPGRTGNGNSLAMPIEHEVEVTNESELKEMLKLLGFQPALCITKTRRTTDVGEYEVCIDEVEGLGSFIEVEKLLEHEEDTEETVAMMKVFLESLGVAAEDIGVKRYDVQVLEREYGSI